MRMATHDKTKANTELQMTDAPQLAEMVWMVTLSELMPSVSWTLLITLFSLVVSESVVRSKKPFVPPELVVCADEICESTPNSEAVVL